jgi:hypothetical protein
MRYLKAKNISKWSINDQTLISYPSQFDPAGKGNRVVMNATGGLMLPKGTTEQRPLISGVRQPTDANGTIRYNTTTRTLEAYIDDVWEVVKASGALAITKQTLGPGDGNSSIFGPLNTVPLNTSYQASDFNIIVLVENVFQISPTNYTVVQNPFAPNYTGDGSEIDVNNIVEGEEYFILTAGDTDFTTIGAPNNDVGTVFVATGPGIGTGVVRKAGYYLRFTSAVPASGNGGDPVFITVFYGYSD